jgi:uncharacterized membrane protein
MESDELSPTVLKPRAAAGRRANRRGLRAALVALALAILLAPTLALAARSGGSFSSRGGFRSAPSAPRGYSSPGRGYGYGGGRDVVVVPGFGWGWGWGGYGGGGGSLFGTVLMLAVFGIGAALVVRTLRRAAGRGVWQGVAGDDDERDVDLGRAYVYELQLGLGRSARGVQERLARFAAEGDTSSEAGLASLLQQTTLELLREKDSIRYARAESAGPLSLTNAETKMNALALAERSRYQVERVRGAEGQVRRAADAPVVGAEVLEYLVVTVVVATRTPLPGLQAVDDRAAVDGALAALGSVAPSSLLGLEVIWTPADPDDSLTQADLLTSYPQLRSI